jgi:hypothetical protein
MRIAETYRQFGWRIVPRIFKSLLRRFGIQTETFYLLGCEINKGDISRKMEAYDFTDVLELSFDDLDRSEAFSVDKKTLFAKRLNSNDYSCYGIKDNDELVYSTWISWKYMSYPGTFKKSELLTAEEALLEDSYCSPDYRGKGFHSKMNLFRMQKIAERGKSSILALVLKENSPALKVQLKSGFVIKKKISFLKIGSRVRIKEVVQNDKV